MFSIKQLKKFLKHNIIAADDECKGETTWREGLQITYGYANQANLISPFAGLQCTSMALTAIMYWHCKGHPQQLTPRDVNEILDTGNRLHTTFRSRGVSTIGDGKVGIYDIPYLNSFIIFDIFEKEKVSVRLAQEIMPVFTSQEGAQAGLQGLKEFIEAYMPDSPNVGFVVTVSEFSYAIIRSGIGQYLLFDSHGNLKLHGDVIVERALVISFPTLTRLIGMLQDMFGWSELCDIAPVACLYTDNPARRAVTPTDSTSDSDMTTDSSTDSTTDTTTDTTTNMTTDMTTNMTTDMTTDLTSDSDMTTDSTTDTTSDTTTDSDMTDEPNHTPRATLIQSKPLAHGTVHETQSMPEIPHRNSIFTASYKPKKQGSKSARQAKVQCVILDDDDDCSPFVSFMGSRMC